MKYIYIGRHFTWFEIFCITVSTGSSFCRRQKLESVIHHQKLCQVCLFTFVRVEGGSTRTTFIKHLKGAKIIKVWEPLV
jgi:hypothetical protein